MSQAWTSLNWVSQAVGNIQPALGPSKSKRLERGRTLANQWAMCALVGDHKAAERQARQCQRKPPEGFTRGRQD